MRTKANIPLLLFLFCTAAAPAAEEFEDSIPIELAKIFLGIEGAGEAGIYREIPENFPQFSLPQGFTLLGAIDREIQRQVVMESRLAPEEAEQAMLDSLEAQGWTALPDPRADFPQGGFISSSPPAFPRRACHNEHGTVSVNAREYASGSLLSLTHTGASVMGLGPEGCNQYLQPQGPGLAALQARQGLRRYMPRLVVPEEADSGRRGPLIDGGFSSSGNREAESSTELAIDWEMERLHRHFAEQIEEQGWRRDSDWEGEYLSGSSWLRESDDGNPLLGALNLVRLAPGAYELRFRIRALSGREGGANAILGVREYFIR